MTNNQSKITESKINKYYYGKIYKIISEHTKDIYIGSTTQPLNMRFSYHKYSKHTCSSRKLFELGKCEIVLVEEYPCINKKELLIRERYYFDKLLNIVNINKPYLTDAEKKINKKKWIDLCNIKYNKRWANNYILKKFTN